MANFNNAKAYHQFSELGCVIKELVWVAAAISSDYDDQFLEDLSEWEVKDLQRVFGLKKPLLDWLPSDNLEKEAIQDWLLKEEKLGLYAEVGKFNCRNFSFDDKGKVTGFSTSMGHQYVLYVYGETPQLLMAAIKEASDKAFQEMIDRELAKKAKESEVTNG